MTGMTLGPSRMIAASAIPEGGQISVHPSVLAAKLSPQMPLAMYHAARNARLSAM